MDTLLPVEFFRERAQLCEQLAAGSTLAHIQRRLRRLAEDYLARASQFDTATGTAKPGSTIAKPRQPDEWTSGS